MFVCFPAWDYNSDALAHGFVEHVEGKSVWSSLDAIFDGDSRQKRNFGKFGRGVALEILVEQGKHGERRFVLLRNVADSQNEVWATVELYFIIRS